MKREIRQTTDGSVTVIVPETGITFHSVNGAIQESLHVFIDAGLNYWLSNNQDKVCRIFEMGFGTGLNALLTIREAEQQQRVIQYETVELYPLEDDLVAQLNYCEVMQQPALTGAFSTMHNCVWGQHTIINPCFSLKKINQSLLNCSTDQPFNLIYFDAFDPRAQPELWGEKIFHKLYNMLWPGGILVTYSSKGTVRRAMQAAGFTVEKLPGALGKREMVRASRQS